MQEQDMKKLAILATIALLGGGTVAVAQQAQHHRPQPRPPLPGPGGNWTTIGYTTVGSGRDRDVIRVRGNERHRQLRVCALNRAIEMRDLDVRFNNGGRQDIPVRQIIRAGSCTAAKDLKGQRRNMQSVQIVYSRIRGVLPVVRIQAR
jgi:hypothetical protein